MFCNLDGGECALKRTFFCSFALVQTTLGKTILQQGKLQLHFMKSPNSLTSIHEIFHLWCSIQKCFCTVLHIYVVLRGVEVKSEQVNLQSFVKDGE